MASPEPGAGNGRWGRRADPRYVEVGAALGALAVAVRLALPLGAANDVANGLIEAALVVAAVASAQGAQRRGDRGPAAAARTGLAYGVLYSLGIAVFPFPRAELTTLLSQKLPGLSAPALARWSAVLASAGGRLGQIGVVLVMSWAVPLALGWLTVRVLAGRRRPRPAGPGR
jgi:hypothetical protein